MKRFFIAAAAALVFSVPAFAQTSATPAAPVPPAGFSVATSTIGDLLDHPAAKAVFAKYLPDLVSNPQLDQGRGMTLPEIVQYVPDLTPEKLSAIDGELKALPPE